MALTGKEELYASSRNGGRATIRVSELPSGGGNVIDQTYTITGAFEEQRTLDAENSSQMDLMNFVATIVNDMGDAGIIKVVIEN